jgi:hypothetical protein
MVALCCRAALGFGACRPEPVIENPTGRRSRADTSPPTVVGVDRSSAVSKKARPRNRAARPPVGQQPGGMTMAAADGFGYLAATLVPWLRAAKRRVSPGDRAGCVESSCEGPSGMTG